MISNNLSERTVTCLWSGKAGQGLFVVLVKLLILCQLFNGILEILFLR